MAQYEATRLDFLFDGLGNVMFHSSDSLSNSALLLVISASSILDRRGCGSSGFFALSSFILDLFGLILEPRHGHDHGLPRTDANEAKYERDWPEQEARKYPRERHVKVADRYDS